jgi:hypothetical protein
MFVDVLGRFVEGTRQGADLVRRAKDDGDISCADAGSKMQKHDNGDLSGGAIVRSLRRRLCCFLGAGDQILKYGCYLSFGVLLSYILPSLRLDTPSECFLCGSTPFKFS